MTGLSCSPTRRTPRTSGPKFARRAGTGRIGPAPPAVSSPTPAGPPAGASRARCRPPHRQAARRRPRTRRRRRAERVAPTSRCQRAKSPRWVRPMLPAQAPDRDAGPRPVVDHRTSTRGRPTSGRAGPSAGARRRPGSAAAWPVLPAGAHTAMRGPVSPGSGSSRSTRSVRSCRSDQSTTDRPRGRPSARRARPRRRARALSADRAARARGSGCRCRSRRCTRVWVGPAGGRLEASDEHRRRGLADPAASLK